MNEYSIRQLSDLLTADQTRRTQASEAESARIKQAESNRQQVSEAIKNIVWPRVQQFSELLKKFGHVIGSEPSNLAWQRGPLTRLRVDVSPSRFPLREENCSIEFVQVSESNTVDVTLRIAKGNATTIYTFTANDPRAGELDEALVDAARQIIGE